MEAVPFDAARWAWDGEEPRRAELRGRECVLVENTTGTVADVELEDGVVELELAVCGERGFHGVFWRAVDGENFESFFVRPHQVGNPDSVQYTPVFNGVGGFQLYHGDGYWATVSFPLGEWFRIRVVFAGDRAEIFVSDEREPVLCVGALERDRAAGRIGVFSSLAPVHVAGFAFDPTPAAFRKPAPRPGRRLDGTVRLWLVSDPFREDALDDALTAERRWSRLESGPTGLVNLARLAGIRDGRNTVLARTTIRSEREQTVGLQLGFSDRAAVYLGGRLLYRGDDAYRSRDYRFLGSIGYWDTVYLPLAHGDNELTVAVSEDFGGWGVQARLPELRHAAVVER